MGTLTGADFISELRYILGNRQETSLPAARLLRWTNHAYQHVTNPRVQSFPELGEDLDITLVAADHDYTLTKGAPGPEFTLRGVRDVIYYNDTVTGPTVNKRNLSPKDVDWFNNHALASGGWPTVYCWDFVGRQLLISPVPTATEAGNILRVLYYAAPDNLVAGTATVIEDPYWDEVILNGAKWIAEWAMGYRELAIASRQIYAEMINEPADGQELQASDTGFTSEFKNDPYMPVG